MKQSLSASVVVITTISMMMVGSDGFVVVPKSSRGKMTTLYKDVDRDALAFNPYEGYQSVDIDRAKECAENFGKCSTAEMEELRANLHKERMQSFIFGGSKDSLEHLILEDELVLQLALLEDKTTTDNSLFPNEMEETIEPSLFPNEMEPALPHINDSPEMKAQNDDHSHTSGLLPKPTPMQVLAIEESILEENTLEAFMFCAVLAAFILLPQLTG